MTTAGETEQSGLLLNYLFMISNKNPTSIF